MCICACAFACKCVFVRVCVCKRVGVHACWGLIAQLCMPTEAKGSLHLLMAAAMLGGLRPSPMAGHKRPGRAPRKSTWDLRLSEAACAYDPRSTCRHPGCLGCSGCACFAGRTRRLDQAQKQLGPYGCVTHRFPVCAAAPLCVLSPCEVLPVYCSTGMPRFGPYLPLGCARQAHLRHVLLPCRTGPAGHRGHRQKDQAVGHQ